MAQVHSGWTVEKPARKHAAINGPLGPRVCPECGKDFIAVARNQATCRTPNCLRSRERKQREELMNR